ncbi:hypothetical protein D7294_03305 [Streptomyces hoynatensis]|uniref:Uncharacterized protein n=1 Tax=Streptomyces hoynatensis TaxID=1141874 RepID=A0A3A9ZJ05_9ACTN|nr:hypothetical protein D7294_03305 [Streptomyces hoynatensis]
MRRVRQSAAATSGTSGAEGGEGPVDAGRSHLIHTGSTGETVALCVTRRFAVGQCFLGMADGGANLMSRVDCQGEVPSPYSQTYHVTGVYAAPAQHQAGECNRVANDPTQYASWFVDGGSVLVCAVVFTG